jgi:hypothetical protein
MERLFCDAWRYAPTAERKQWTFARASPLACGCSDCIARLVALTDSAEQQQTVRQMASQICAMSRPRCCAPAAEALQCMRDGASRLTHTSSRGGDAAFTVPVVLCRKAMMARAVRQLLECHDIFVSSVTGVQLSLACGWSLMA